MEEKFAISIYVCNKPGVLVRLAQTFARRGYNVDSLVVSPAHDTNFSRITVVVQGEPSTYDQIIRQLNKLVDVVHAKSHDSTDVVDREMAFFKVKVDFFDILRAAGQLFFFISVIAFLAIPKSFLL